MIQTAEIWVSKRELPMLKGKGEDTAGFLVLKVVNSLTYEIDQILSQQEVEHLLVEGWRVEIHP